MTTRKQSDQRASGNRGPLLAIAALLVAVGAALYLQPEPDSDTASVETSAQAPIGAEDTSASDTAIPQPSAPDASPVAEGLLAETDTADSDAPTGSTSSTEDDVAATTTADAPLTDEPATADEVSGEEPSATAALATDDKIKAQPAAVPPSFDEVRLDAGGVLIVAGRAAPGDEVALFVDGDEVGKSLADGQGAFAAIAVLPEVARARVLTLRARNGAGEVASLDEVILAPRAVQAKPADRDQQVAALDDAEKDDMLAQSVPSDEASPSSNAGVDDAEMRGTDTEGDATETSAEAGLQASVAEDVQRPQADAGESGTSRDLQNAAPAENAPVDGSDVLAPESDPGAQVAILKSDSEGVSLVQPQLAAPDRVALDTIGYSDSGVVQLSGRASVEASEIRVYLDNRAVARLPVDASGNWRGDIPDVDAGVYTLRVDGVDADGSVTSRIETPFKREAPATLAQVEAAATGPVTAVTVQTGDTLWAIARERYGEGLLYVRVFDANRTAIRDPDLIYPGQVFDLPAP